MHSAAVVEFIFPWCESEGTDHWICLSLELFSASCNEYRSLTYRNNGIREIKLLKYRKYSHPGMCPQYRIELARARTFVLVLCSAHASMAIFCIFFQFSVFFYLEAAISSKFSWHLKKVSYMEYNCGKPK